MKKRQLHFICTNHACEKLAKVLSTYAHAAFPVGGSDCAQATRESLLDMALRLAENKDDVFAINPRQIPMLKSAIKWYFSEVEDNSHLQMSLLGKLSRR